MYQKNGWKGGGAYSSSRYCILLVGFNWTFGSRGVDQAMYTAESNLLRIRLFCKYS